MVNKSRNMDNIATFSKLLSIYLTALALNLLKGFPRALEENPSTSSGRAQEIVYVFVNLAIKSLGTQKKSCVFIHSSF